jgi:hypothetical protein
MNDEINNTKKYSIFLFYSSFSMGLAMIISYIMNDLYISLYFLFLFLSSINHWRRYEYGLRRNIDLLIVNMGGAFTILKVCLLKNEINRYIVLSILFCMLIFYILEYVLVYFNSNKWVLLHMTIHLYTCLLVLFVLFD